MIIINIDKSLNPWDYPKACSQSGLDTKRSSLSPGEMLKLRARVHNKTPVPKYDWLFSVLLIVIWRHSVTRASCCLFLSLTGNSFSNYFTYVMANSDLKRWGRDKLRHELMFILTLLLTSARSPTVPILSACLTCSFSIMD